RETQFLYGGQHDLGEPGKPDDGDSHTADRLADLLESGASGDRKGADGMVLAGKQENPPTQQPAVVQMPAETKEAKQYRSFASEILASFVQRPGRDARQGREVPGSC